MGQHRFDVEDLLLESDVSDQTVFIATDVEYGQFTDLVYGIEGRLPLFFRASRVPFARA